MYVAIRSRVVNLFDISLRYKTISQKVQYVIARRYWWLEYRYNDFVLKCLQNCYQNCLSNNNYKIILRDDFTQCFIWWYLRTYEVIHARSKIAHVLKHLLTHQYLSWIKLKARQAVVRQNSWILMRSTSSGAFWQCVVIVRWNPSSCISNAKYALDLDLLVMFLTFLGLVYIASYHPYGLICFKTRLFIPRAYLFYISSACFHYLSILSTAWLAYPCNLRPYPVR